MLMEVCGSGYGIILTATWILPVALIPGTWNERDFPPASPGPQDPPSLPFSLPGAGPGPIPGSAGDTNVHHGASSSSFPSLPTTPGAAATADHLSTPVPRPLLTPPTSPSLSPSPIRSSPPPEPHPSPQLYPTSPPTTFTPVSSPASPAPLSPPLPSAVLPPAPNGRTIPLPEPHHSPGLDPSRFRSLPDLPGDLGGVHHLQPESPPPAPTPRTIPLPDIEDRPKRSRKGKGKGREKVDGMERKFWKKSPKHQSNTKTASAQAVFGS